MDKVKRLFSPQAGDTYHSHQAGAPDGVYHRPSVDETAGTGVNSTEDKESRSGAQPGTLPYTSGEPSSATGGPSYGTSARREYGTSATSGLQNTTRTTSTASQPSSPTKYTNPTNFAYGGPSYQSKSSRTNTTSTALTHNTGRSTRDPTSSSAYETASPSYNTMKSNSSNPLPPGAFVDDTPNSTRSTIGGTGPSMDTTGAPQIGRQDLGESLDSYPAGSTSGSGTTGNQGPYGTSSGYGTSGTDTGDDGTTSAAGAGLTGATLADRSVTGGNMSGRSGADYKGTDNFTPHPHDVDASNKPLAAPEDDDAARTSAPATQIAARVMGAGGTESYSNTAAPGTASTTSGNTAMPSMTSGSSNSRSVEPTSSSLNYGRDDAVGAGGLGAGVARATILSGRTGDGLDPSDSGPASSTVGPHSSNFANIMDPRVKPDPSKMHGSDSAATTGGSAAGAGAFPAGTATSSTQHPTTSTTGPQATQGGAYSTYDGGRAAPQTGDHHLGRGAGVVGGTGAAGAAGHEAYAHGRHPDAAPYSTERHVERDLYESEQTRGGPLGFVHKHQESKYADKDEPNTTARDKYFGNDGATQGRDPVSGRGSSTATGAGGAALGGTTFEEGGHRGTSGHGGQSIGGGAGHRAYDDASTGTTSHDYGTGKSGTTDSSQASPEESGRASMDSQGRPKKRGLMDRILHREAPSKLHKEPPS